MSAVRRSLFLVLGFLAGLTPALLSFSGAPSTHRMMCAFIFIPIACGASFQLTERFIRSGLGRRINTTLAIAFIGVTSYQSILLFFSDKFWAESNRIFFNSETALAESIRLPTSPPLAAGLHINRILEARNVPMSGVVNMSLEHLAPPQPMTLAISPALYSLVPFYKENVPAECVSSFGIGPYETSIKVEFTEAEVERWRRYGWTAERRCSDRTLYDIHLPFFYLPNELGWRDPCPNQREVVMKAKWLRERTELSLVTFRGASVKLETSSGLRIPASTEQRSERKITLAPGEIVTITVTSVHGSSAWLEEGSGQDAKIPKLESFEPIKP